MPRNNLGGEATKSLTGSPDATRAVKLMRDAARSRDRLLPVARARELAAAPGETPCGPLTHYLESPASLDSYLLSLTGQITQRRFINVQERLGYFSNRCPFAAPPRRRA
jgi:hypothetical protein